MREFSLGKFVHLATCVMIIECVTLVRAITVDEGNVPIFASDDLKLFIDDSSLRSVLDVTDFALDDISEISDTPDPISDGPPVRVRRQAGVFGGLAVRGLSATQDCDGILVWWVRLPLPFNLKLHSVNSEFKHFNIYRSNAYFDDVMGMTPYVDGSREPSLQNVHTDRWKDYYPTSHLPMYYAVTVVHKDGSETTKIDAKKVTFVGAIKKMGNALTIIPGILRGDVLHHSVAYNPIRNEYLVAFDLDINSDKKPDKLYAIRLNTQGNIMDRTILDFTARLPGRVDQGWPSVVFNPKSNEYFALYQIRSTAHFGGKYFIIGQRIMAAKTERAANPQMVIKAQANGIFIDAIDPHMIYNPATGGYVAALVVVQKPNEAFSIFLDGLGQLQRTESICNYKSNAYEPRLFLDEKRNEILFACTVDRSGANADFQLGSAPYVILMTKKNATGAHAANTLTANTKLFIGYTNKPLSRIEGYYNGLIDRVELFWENEKNGKHTISKASVMITQTQSVKEVKQDFDCAINKEIRTPVAQFLPESGGYYLLWQEKVGSVWSIGGHLLQGGNMNNANREQRNPVMVYNRQLAAPFVVWQEVVGGTVRLVGRHVTKSSAPTCQPRCEGSQRCAMQDVCVQRDFDPCAIKNGGCANTCTTSVTKQVTCSCPSGMTLSEDGITCQNQLQTAPLPPYEILAVSLNSLWQINIDSRRKLGLFNKIPISHGQSFVAIARDSIDEYVFWSDVDGKMINRAKMDGTGEQSIITTDVQVPDGIAVDVIGRKIYWTDGGLQRITRANFDGTNRETFVNGLDKPRAIALFRPTRLVYWSDWGADAKIERIQLDRNHRRTIVSGNLAWPNGLVIDEAASQLFWVDAKLDKIETSDLLGRGRRTLLSGNQRLKHPFSLAVFKNRLFWSDWGTSSINSIDKITGKDIEIVVQNLQRPSGIVVYESSAPAVQTRCPDPGTPRGGGRNPVPDSDGKYSVGSSLRHTCNPGKNLKGSRVRTCLSTSEWSGQPVKCIAPPIFQNIPTNTTVNETDTALLKCTVSDRNIKLRWLKDGKDLRVLGDVFILTAGHLFFTSVRLSDRGWYSCVAKNEGGEKKITVYLDVKRPLNKNCGNPTFTARGKIIGGRRAVRGTHPWQVSLWNNKTGNHFCGGSLIADRWIVTAAHCVAGLFGRDFVVRLGKYNQKVYEDFAIDVRAKQIKVHPSFNEKTFESDLALIQLEITVIFTDYIKPICLPLSHSDSSLVEPGTEGIISGWGARKEGKKAVGKLHEVKIPIVDTQTCARAHPKYTITSNMFCAGTGTTDTSGDACQGDSGGPFSVDSPPVSRPSARRHVLLGIISWGEGCGRVGKYGVYTRLTRAFVDWIKKEVSL